MKNKSGKNFRSLLRFQSGAEIRSCPLLSTGITLWRVGCLLMEFRFSTEASKWWLASKLNNKSSCCKNKTTICIRLSEDVNSKESYQSKVEMTLSLQYATNPSMIQGLGFQWTKSVVWPSFKSIEAGRKWWSLWIKRLNCPTTPQINRTQGMHQNKLRRKSRCKLDFNPCNQSGTRLRGVLGFWGFWVVEYELVFKTGCHN